MYVLNQAIAYIVVINVMVILSVKCDTFDVEKNFR